MKIKVSIVYLVLYVLGIIGVGILTGIYGDSISMWVSYGFLAVYGIMIMTNATLIERVSEVKTEKEQEVPGDIGELPSSLGAEKKLGEATIETRESPLPPKEIKEEAKEETRKLTEAEIKIVEKIAKYVKDNLEKGHDLETIRKPLDKIYGTQAVDFVLQKAIKVQEPELPDLGESELPDLGEPEEVVTPKTLDDDIKNESKTKGFKCSKCGKTFKKSHLMKNHMRLSKKCQS